MIDLLDRLNEIQAEYDKQAKEDGDLMQTVAEGWWCENCETFEQDDEINTEVPQCQLCGCSGVDHRPVEIVTKGLA